MPYWTLEKEGTERVAIVGKDDKRQITAVIGCLMSWDVLPFQLNREQYLKVYVSCVGPAVTLWACKLDGQWSMAQPGWLFLIGYLYKVFFVCMACQDVYHPSLHRNW